MADDKLTVEKSTIESVVKLLLTPFAFFIQAWAIATMWMWFVVPLGVTTINYWQALGLHFFIGLFTMRLVQTGRTVSLEEFVAKMISPAVIVGIGYLIK